MAKPKKQILRKQAIQELVLCSQDPIYFIENYCWVRHPKRGLVPFALYEYQKDTIRAYVSNDRVIINKARQLGFSTLTAAFIAWLILFHNDKEVLVIANKKDTAVNVIKKVKLILSKIPTWMHLSEIVKNQVHTLALANGSQVKAVAGQSEDAGRSEAVALLVIDEAAIIRNFDEVWKSLKSTVSCLHPDTKVLVEDKGFIAIKDLFPAAKSPGDYFEIDNLKIHDGESFKAATKGYISPASNLLEVKTRRGSKVKVTADHPLLCLRSEMPKMVKSKDLKLGDWIKVSFGTNVYGKESIPDDLAYVLGGYIAEGFFGGQRQKDGSTKYYRVDICNSDKNFKEAFLKTEIKGKKFVQNKNREDILNLNSVESVNFLISECGLNPKLKCYNKVTPSKIFSCNKKTQSEYLAGLFDGDGCVCINRGISLVSTSLALLEETKMLLNNFGIFSNIFARSAEKALERERRTKRLLPQGKEIKSIRDSWSLNIPFSCTKKFKENIPLKIPYKKKNLEKIIKIRKQDDFKLWRVPSFAVRDLIFSIIQESGLNENYFRKRGLRLDKLKHFKSKTVNAKFINSFIDIIDESDYILPSSVRKTLEDFIGNFYWDEISEISEGGFSISYDFTVPESGKFLQNGIVGSNTGGKIFAMSCVTKDTFVYTNRGIKQVGDFISRPDVLGGYEVEKYSVRGNGKLRSSNLFHNNGKVKTRKIITKLAELEGSENHKLWACKSGEYGWYRLDQLEEGDWINVQYGMNCWGENDDVSDFQPEITSNHKNIFKPSKITPDIAYVLGLYLSEGSSFLNKNKEGNLIGGSISFTCGDDLSENLNKLGLYVYKNPDKIHYEISSKTLVEFFQYLGFELGNKAHQKEIPSRLMEMSKENIAAMLSGIFDGDGSSHGTRGAVSIPLSSEKLIDQIRALLLNFGIKSYKQKRTVEQLNESLPENWYPFKHDSHRLELNGYNSKKFYEEIGFKFERKQKNKEALPKKFKNTHDVIPYSLNIVKEMFEKYPKGCWTIEKYHGLQLNNIVNKKKEYKTEHISRDVVFKMFDISKEYLDENYVKEIKDKILIDDSEWTQIKEIQESENETFDFSLPDEVDDFWDHSVVYNGILGHNTPKGVGNWFHTIYTDAQDGVNNWTPMLVNWWENPDYAEGLVDDPNVPGGKTSPWFKDFTSDMTEQQIRQELLTSFVESGDTFIDAKVITRLQAEATEPLLKNEPLPGLWIWKGPQPGKKYLIACDVADGSPGAGDYSTMQVLDLKADSECRIEQVAEFKGKLRPDQLAEAGIQLAQKYNHAHIVFEQNAVGYAANITAMKMGYNKLCYFNKTTGRLVDRWTADYEGIIAGFRTTSTNRPVFLAKFQEFLSKKYLIVNSSRLANELMTFIIINGKPQAAKYRNDDLVMAMAIGVWVREFCPDFGEAAYDLVSLYRAVSVSSKSSEDLMLNDTERASLRKEKIRDQLRKQMTLEMPGGESVDMSWIYIK